MSWFSCFFQPPTSEHPEGMRLHSYFRLYKTILTNMNQPRYKARLRLEMFTYISHLDEMIQIALEQLEPKLSSLEFAYYERTFHKYQLEFRQTLQIKYTQKKLHIPKALRSYSDIRDLFGLKESEA